MGLNSGQGRGILRYQGVGKQGSELRDQKSGAVRMQPRKASVRTTLNLGFQGLGFPV